MGCESVKRPMYLLIADWVKNENRWVTAKEIAQHFDLDHCKVTNIISYILYDVNEINCETKTIPNQLEGRGCQCQRLIRVNTIDSQLYARLGTVKNTVSTGRTPRIPAIPPSELNCEQKWKMMLSKSMRG